MDEGGYFALTPGVGKVEARFCVEPSAGNPMLAVAAAWGSTTVSQGVGTI